MTRVLKIIIKLVSGDRTITWSLADPKNNLTKAEVETLIDDMIAESAIVYNGVAAESLKNAYVYETNKVDLA